MKIRITGKHLPKHQGMGPSQVMGNSMGFKPFDYQKGMDKITGKFKVNQPGFGYSPMGITQPPPPVNITMPNMPTQQMDDGMTEDFFAGNNIGLSTSPTLSPGEQAQRAGIGPQMNSRDAEFQNSYDQSGSNQYKYDASLYDYHMNNRKDPASKQYKKWFNSKYPQPEFEKFKQGVGNANLIFRGALAGANAITNMVNNKREQSEFNRNWINNGLNPKATPQNFDSRGDYDVNSGLYAEDMMSPVNKGMFTNPYYGTYRQDGGPTLPFEQVMPVFAPDPIISVPEFDMMSSPMNNDAPPAPSSNVASPISSSKSLNPKIHETWTDVSSQFKNVKHLGAWGDKRHQQRKSDHNVGDALDIGISDKTQGDNIAQKLIQEAKEKNIKYIIWDKKIWNPSISNEWRPYVGENPHSTHVHISFNRGSKNQENNELGGLAVKNNNPGNIHHGEYVKKWNATKGDSDNNGHVATFNNIDDGLEAMNELLFGSKYNNFTVSEARNKWVSGNPSISNPSTANIVKKIGKDVPLNKLTPDEKKLLISEFVKWEDRGMYEKMKQQKYFKQGGEFDSSVENNYMRIRIKGVPNMAYGGQMGYGLDLNQRKVYTDMPDSYTDSVSKSMSEEDVPDEEYAIEAEGGETIYHPDGSHYNIEGDRHTQGGVKLTKEQAPEGSFVFSDTAKMRIGGDVLKMFGKPIGKKYTPAQIAKQYDINKYQAILDDKHADPLKKKTSEWMKENYQNKLAQLSLVQESKKNFQNGIPQMALPYLQSIMGAMPQQDGGQEEMAQVKYGGHLTKYQELGTVNPVQFDINGKKISASKSNKAPDSKEGWKEIHRAANRVLYELPGKPGQTIQGSPGASWKAGMNVPGGGRSPISYTLDDLNRNPNLYKTFLEKEGWKNATPQEQEAALKRLATGQRSVYVPGLPPTNGQAIDPRYLYTETAEPDSSESTSTSQESERGADILAGTAPQMMSSRNNRQGWMMPDKVNMLNALSQRPKKYLPFIPDIQVATPQPTFDDWRGRAAARQSMYNTSAQTMGAYGPTQGLASNLSYMAGQQGDALSRDIGDVSRYNTGIANQFSAGSAELMNKANEYRANRQKTLFDSNTVANQAYDNSLAGYRNNIAKAFGQGWGNASVLGIRNFIDPYNYIDNNTGQMRSKNVNAMNMIKQMAGNFRGGAGGNDAQYNQALSMATTLKNQGFDPSLIKELLGMKFNNPGGGQQKQGFGVSADMMTPYINPYLQMMGRGQ